MGSIKALLQLLPHKLQVRFALNCAIDAKIHLDKTDTSSLKCIELVEKWLKDPSSVSNAELTAYASTYSASYAAAASDAASTYSAAASAHASSAASYAAHASDYASASASYASYAASAYASASASSAASASRKEKLKQYENDLKEIIKGLTNLQKALCGIN